MRRGRILIFLILIVVVGLGVLFVFLNQGGGGVTPVATQSTVSKVYYASQNIPQGTKITKDLLSTFSIPQENVAEVMFTEGEEVNLVDKIALFTLSPGTLITSSMVGEPPTELAGPPWATNIPTGKVAVAIPTSRLATAAYGVNDGAHVNVTACMTFVDVDPAYQSQLPNFVSTMRNTWSPPESTERDYITIEPLTTEYPSRQGRVELDPTFQKPIYTVPSEAQRPRLVCQLILQNVVVLNLGNFKLPESSPIPNATPAPVQNEPPPDIITLIVDPQDSISLNYFVYSGAVITMALRKQNDDSRIEDAQAATLTFLLSQYNISLPSKLPYAQQPRLDSLTPPLLPNDIIQPTQ